MSALTPELQVGYAAIEAMKIDILDLGPISLIEMIEVVRDIAHGLEFREASAIARAVQAAPDFDVVHKVLKLDKLCTFLEVCEKRPADAAKRLYAVAGRR